MTQFGLMVHFFPLVTLLFFRISWLCTLLLGCISFPPLKGKNSFITLDPVQPSELDLKSAYSLTGHSIAHGDSLSYDGFSSHAGVVGPQTSNQFHSEASLNTNHDSVSPRDSFVSSQREPVHHENNEDADFVTSLSEEMAQNNADSGHEPDKFPSVPSVQKYEHESSGYQHPFGLLVKENTQKQSVEGLSFPSITDFKQFIETMKSSFLTPGSDLTRHFQTAHKVLKNEVALKGETDTGHTSYHAKEGAAHDASENEVWSEPMNTVFEKSEQGINYQMPSEGLSVTDPVVSAESLFSSTLYDSQGLSQDSALYAHTHSAATEHASRNYGSFDKDGTSGENPDIFTSASTVQNDVRSTSYKLPESPGEDFSFSGHTAASSVNPQNRPSQDFSHYSSKISNLTPLSSKKIIPKPKYTLQSKDSLTGHQNPSGGFELEDFQSEQLGRDVPVSVLFAPKPPSLNSYGKSVHVSTPRRQYFIPDYLPKHRQRPAPSFPPQQPPVGKGSKDINYTPTIHQPVSSGSVSLNSDNLSPQTSSGHVGVQTSSQQNVQNQLFSREQPVRSHQAFTVKPSSPLNNNLGDQRVGVTPPSILTDQAKDDEGSIPSEGNQVFAIQEPKQLTGNTPSGTSSVLDSTQTGISSMVDDDFASFNSATNLVPTSASEMPFSSLYGIEAMSRNFESKNMISNRFMHDARNHLGSFFTPQRRGYVGATRTGFPKNVLLNKVRKRPANVNNETSNMSHQYSKPLSASRVSGSTFGGVNWRNGENTKRLPSQTGPSKSAPFVKTYVVKSRKSYKRGKESLSKTYYTPYRLDEDRSVDHQWKPTPRRQKYENTVSHNAKRSADK